MDQALRNPQPLRPEQCPAYIMAGGRSSRFGSDKARVQIGGSPLLLVLRRELIAQGHSVEIVADRVDRYADLGIECLLDWQADQGPVAGVATALKHREQQQPGWLLLLSCDLFVWRAAWFEQLSSALEQLPAIAKSADAETVVAADAGERQKDINAVAFRRRTAARELQAEPFPSLLHSRLWPQAVALLDRQKRSLQSLFADARTAAIDTPDTPQAWTFNTVEQLQALASLRKIPYAGEGIVDAR